MMEYPEFKVCCRCFTFNQSKYITDTMNGFTMQQTSFPFVCTIVDDASTDGEQEVIRKYVEDNFDFSEGSVAYNKETDYAYVTYAQHETNKNCYFVVLYLKENHYSQRKPKMGYLSEWRDICEYEAPCEGDDYWIDSRKIQKQVTLLDNYPDCAMCYSSARYYYQNKGRFSRKPRGGKSESFKDLLVNNTIPTPTVLLRIQCLSDYQKKICPQNKKWLMGDYPMWLYLSKKYEIKFLRGEVLAVYRVLDNSASHNSDFREKEKFIKSTVDIQTFFTNYFGCTDLLEKQKLEKYLFSNAVFYGEREKAKKLFKKIESPSWNMRIKYFIIQNNILYKICKGRLFQTLNN